MDPVLFQEDLRRKPETLEHLATHLDATDPWGSVVPGLLTASSHVMLLGMGSSYFAASVAAARLRARGVQAVAELASSDLLPAVDERTVVIAVSAGGGSPETRAAVAHYVGRCPVVLLTNKPGSELASAAGAVVDLVADEERGGVACRSFQHTLALLLALEARLVPTEARDVPALVRAAALASQAILDAMPSWLPDLRRLLVGPQGTHVVAPARRLASAQQSALMLREGPRLPAYACETGDWSHIDVYLTKSTDYRMLLLPGSRWEPELWDWVGRRGSTVVSLGADLGGAALSLRYAGDEDDDVRLLAEVTAAELLAADLWSSPA